MSASTPGPLGRATVQALLREVNDQIAEAFDEYRPGDAGSLHLVCECGQARCSELVGIDRSLFDEVRSVPGRRIVLRGHEGDDQVVHQGARFAIVE